MERLGKYDIRRLVGRGGMAEVFEAEMRGPAGFKKSVCIKQIRREYAAHPQFRAAFESEARIAATLHHPNVVEIYDFDRVGDQLYLVMEYVDGVDLQTILNETREMGLNVPIGFAVHVMQGLLSALDHAHTQTIDQVPTPIIHRDVSPQNILIAGDCSVKLTDFGIAKAKGLSATTIPGTVKGKLAYLSPEQAEGRSITPATDLFSAGAVFYEMLTGERLFSGESASQIFVKIRSYNFKPIPFLSQDINRFLSLLLAYAPSKRFESAACALEILHRITSAYTAAPASASRIVEDMSMRRLGNTALMPRNQNDCSDTVVEGASPHTRSSRQNDCSDTVVEGASPHTQSSLTPVPAAIPMASRPSTPKSTVTSSVRLRPAVVFLWASIGVGLVFLTLATGHFWSANNKFPTPKKSLPPVAVPLKSPNSPAFTETKASPSRIPKVNMPETIEVKTQEQGDSDALHREPVPQSISPTKTNKRETSRKTPVKKQPSRTQKTVVPPQTDVEKPNPTDIELLKQRRVSFETLED